MSAVTSTMLARYDRDASLPEHLDWLADAVLDVMRAAADDTTPGAARTFTPSSLNRAATRNEANLNDVRIVLHYLAASAQIDHDDRGAWTRYWCPQ